MTDQTKYIDHLDEDDRVCFPHAIEMENRVEKDYQNWYCVSFLSPEGIKNCSTRGLKIRGVYGTKAEADARAKELQETDPNFHVFVGEMGKWCPWDPDPNSIKDQQYQEQELNDLMKGYKDNLDKSKKMQKERKDDMIKQAAAKNAQQQQPSNPDPHHSSNNKTKAKLQQKLAERAAVNAENEKQKELMKSYAEPPVLPAHLAEDENVVKTERERLNTLGNTINDKKQNIESINDKLAKIKELYEKANSK